jgi:hypothetical protein
MPKAVGSVGVTFVAGRVIAVGGEGITTAADAVQAFDVRFDTKDLDPLTSYLKKHYGKPFAETRETIQGRGAIYKVRWESGQDQAVLVAQLDKRRAALSVSRGKFDEEIYRIR